MYDNNQQCATIRNRVTIMTNKGKADFISFHHLKDKKEHIGIVFKDADQQNNPLVRIHSECLTGDVFFSHHCDCGEQLEDALSMMSETGGIILYLRQEGRGIGLYNKLDAYTLQKKGFDTYEANQLLDFDDDLRDYVVASQMLGALHIKTIRLLTNNPDKLNQLSNLGVKITQQVKTKIHVKDDNINYLQAKCYKHRHDMSLLNDLA